MSAQQPVQPLSDDELASHLRRRGVASAPDELVAAIASRVAVTPRGPRWRFLAGDLRVPAAAFAAVVVVAVLGSTLLLSGRTTPGPGATPTSMASPASAQPALAWDPASGPMTTAQLGDLMANWRLDLAGRFVVADVTLVASPYSVRCAPPASGATSLCEATVIDGIQPAVAVARYQREPGGTFDFALPLTGPLAFRLDARDRVTLVGVVPLFPDRLPHGVQESVQAGIVGMVNGWLVGQGPVPCPMPLTNAFETWDQRPLRFGCPASWLTDQRTPLDRIDSSDPGTIRLQSAAALAFREAQGAPMEATTPERGTYLVLAHPGKCITVRPGCVGYELVARLDPIELTAQATPPANVPSPSASPSSEPSPSTLGTVVFPLDEGLTRVADGSLASGSLMVIDVPADSVTPRFPKGVVHSCPMICPTWILNAGDRQATVSISMRSVRGIAQPTTTVGRQVFRVLDGGGLLLLGPARTANGDLPLSGVDVPATQSGFAVVHGWVRQDPVAPCPTQSAPLASPFVVGLDGESLEWQGCRSTWLLPSGVDPWRAVQGGYAFDPPPGTLRLQQRAGGLAPETGAREGTYLVRLVFPACPEGVFCALRPALGALWDLVGEVTSP